MSESILTSPRHESNTFLRINSSEFMTLMLKATGILKNGMILT